MSLEKPYREDDLQVRLGELRAEHHRLSRTIEVTLAKAATHATFSWWRFSVGVCVLPAIAWLSWRFSWWR